MSKTKSEKDPNLHVIYIWLLTFISFLNVNPVNPGAKGALKITC